MLSSRSSLSKARRGATEAAVYRSDLAGGILSQRTHRKSCDGEEGVELTWTDEAFAGGQGHYNVIVEAEGDYLITSPIHFSANSR